MRLRVLAVLTTALAVLAGGVFTPADAAGSNLSLNWAGYAVAASNVTSVSGEFTVPQVELGGPGFVAEWVGIGGYNTQDLIQAGIGQDAYVPGAAVDYYAWWEILPAAETVIPNKPVKPGDHVTVTITNTSGSNWTIDMADSTQGWTFQQNVTYNSTKSSAEWIVEAPTLALVAQTVPPRITPAVFDGANKATINGVTQTVGASNPDTLVVPTGSPSAIDSTGDGFTVCEYDAQLNCAPPA
jgi:hypothetical protein